MPANLRKTRYRGFESPSILACALALVAGCGSAPSEPATTAPSPGSSVSAPSERVEDVAGEKDAKVEVEVRRDILVDHCYWGMFTVRLARDLYLAKLAPDEPGPSTTPVLTRGNNRPFAFQKFAGYCAAAVEANKVAPDASAAPLAALHPKTAPAAEVLLQIYACLDASCGKSDGFARARSLTDTLRKSKNDLDPLHDQLGAVVATRVAARSRVASGLLGEAEVATLIEHARPLVAELVAGKGDPASQKTVLATLENDRTALAAAGSRGKSRIVSGGDPAAVRLLKVIRTTLDTTTRDDATRLALVDAFDDLLEAGFRGVLASLQKGGAKVVPTPAAK